MHHSFGAVVKGTVVSMVFVNFVGILGDEILQEGMENIVVWVIEKFYGVLRGWKIVLLGEGIELIFGDC